MEALFGAPLPGRLRTPRRAGAGSRAPRRGRARAPDDGDRAMDAPYAKLEQLEPGIARVLAHNPSAFTYYGTQTYLVGDSEVAVIDPGPDLPEHLDALETRDRRPAGGGDHVHPHPPRPQPRRAAAGGTDRRADHRLRAAGARNGRPARRRVVRRRLSARSRARRRRDGRGRRQADHRGRDAGPHIQPFVLRLRGRLADRRPCDGLVDHGRRPARRRHGGIYAQASTSFGSATTASIIRRTGRR